jgi:hypothetical protein
MPPHQWILLASAGVFLAATAHSVFQIGMYAGMKDPSASRGSAARAVLYSLTGAMSPLKKESARRHLPTYTLGLFFHAGAFSSFGLLALRFIGVTGSPSFARAGAAFLALSFSAGLTLLIKRIANPKLRAISNLDDYASNVLVVGFEVVTALSLLDPRLIPLSFLYGSALLLYIPLGKLRHAIYFPLARIYLGLFYGRRGVWGVKKRKTWEARSR